MKNLKFIYLKITLLSVLLFAVTVSCEREISDEIEFAIASTSANVFIDGFSGGLDYYPYSGSKATAFSVDEDTKYSGTASMRFDVPTVGDSEGAYAGAAFIVGDVQENTGGRNLTNYDALTFYAKATQAATLDNVGFGQDFNGNEFEVTLQNVPISTNWVKYIIPIPDAYKLTLEKGMFWYAEGPEDGKGYTFWIDDLKFEKLGNLGQPQPEMANGEDTEEGNFVGNSFNLSDYGLTQTFNLPSGFNQTTITAPMYFDFESSDIEVVRVSETGIVSIVGPGIAKITASIAGVKAKGSLTISASGAFPLAPTPQESESNVISVFSDTYTNVPVDFHNGYWQPYQTTLGGETIIDGQNILNYTNFKFVGTQLTEAIDITEMTHYSVDLLMLELPADLVNIDILITLKSVDGTFQQNRIGSNYQLDPRAPIVYPASSLVASEWQSIKIPIRPTSETGLNRSAINVIVIENIKSSQIETFYMDNTYFYK